MFIDNQLVMEMRDSELEMRNFNRKELINVAYPLLFRNKKGADDTFPAL